MYALTHLRGLAVMSLVTSLALSEPQFPHPQKEGSDCITYVVIFHCKTLSISALIKELRNSVCHANSQISSIFHPHSSTV